MRIIIIIILPRVWNLKKIEKKKQAHAFDKIIERRENELFELNDVGALHTKSPEKITS